MSGRSRILTFGLPLVGLSTLVAGAGMVINDRPIRPDEDPPRQPTTAPSASNENIDASRFIGAIGVSEPAGEAISIAANTAGVIRGVPISVGDLVLAGETLFVVDQREAAAAVGEAEAKLVVARADAMSLRASVPPRRAMVESSLAAFESARAGVRAAVADRDDRQNQLRIAEAVDDPRAIASEEVSRRRFAVQQAEARVSTSQAAVSEANARVAEARAQLARLVDPEIDIDGPQLQAAEARITQAERELELARTDLELRTVTSPIDARVLQVNAKLGEFAPASVPSEGLVVLGRSGPQHLRVEIDEVDIPRFNRSARAWASPRGDAASRIELDFVLIEPLVVPKTNLAGRTSELIDTRVLQVVYSLGDQYESPGIGQQFDVYIELVETQGEQ